MDFEIDIIGKFLRFNPVQNTNLSYGGNFIGILSNLWVLVLFNILVILVIISGYAFYKSKNEQTSYSVKVIMSCGLAGTICSLIFIFDLKDCYLTVAEIIFVVIGILHNREISMKEYIYFCYRQFKK